MKNLLKRALNGELTPTEQSNLLIILLGLGLVVAGLQLMAVGS